MRNNIVFIIATSLVLLALLTATSGKVFTRCELKKALEKNKVNRSFITHCKLKTHSCNNIFFLIFSFIFVKRGLLG